MTTKRVVSDDTLGQIATKQWELIRRVKEGTLKPSLVLNALQSIIENAVVQLDIEKVDWNISSTVHEITVEPGSDFVSSVKEFGFAWNYNHREDNAFILEGDGQRRKKKSRFRLAKLTKHEDVPVCVIKTYAEMSGYDLASSWELLSFVRQSAAMRIIKPATHIIALGDYGRTKWCDTGKESFAHVCVNEFLKGRTWSFDKHFSGDTPRLLDDVRVSWYHYILLRERK